MKTFLKKCLACCMLLCLLFSSAFAAEDWGREVIMPYPEELQINVVDRDTLLEARKNPEDYQDLVVRIGGYSARFIDLHRDVQREFIERFGVEISA